MIHTVPGADILLGADCGHDGALYAPCLCRAKVATLPAVQGLQLAQPTSSATLDRLSRLFIENENVWVLLAHERELLNVFRSCGVLLNGRRRDGNSTSMLRVVISW
jgi:hypothetical protein